MPSFQVAKAMSSCIDLEHQLEYTLKQIEERTGKFFYNYTLNIKAELLFLV